VCDVRREADLSAAIERAVAEFGRLDIMYNNAGVATATDGKGHRLIDQGDDDFDRLVSINQRGVYYGCRQAVIPPQRSQSLRAPGLVDRSEQFPLRL